MPPNPYTPVDWVDQVTLVSEPNMDHIEGGIKNITDYGAGLDTRLLALEGRPVVPAVVNGLWLKGSGGSAVWTQIAETDVQNLTADLAAKIPNSLVTAKGDMIAATGGATPARLPVGADGTFLKAASAQTAGVQWAALAETDVANLVSDLAAKENAANKGVSSGYASLGSDGKVPAAQLPPASGAGYTRVSKTTTRDVVNDAGPTDLLNGEMIVPAGAMTANGFIRLTACGDYINTSGGGKIIQLQLKIGSTVVWDSTTPNNAIPNFSPATRQGWFFECLIQGVGSQTSQRTGGYFTISQPGGPNPAAGFGGLNTPLVQAGFSNGSAANMAVQQTVQLMCVHQTALSTVSMRLVNAMMEYA